MRFDHAGIATDDAAALAERYADLLDCPIVHEERFSGMKIVFVDLGGSFFELLEPRADGTIADYLERRGPGIHHLAVRTEADDGGIEGAIERARSQGVELVDETPREGAWGHRVAFCHPGSTGGVLLEFVEH